MKRLLGYLRPYLAQVAFALVAIITESVLQLAPPYLTRLAIDDYIAQRDIGGLPMHRRGCTSRCCSPAFRSNTCRRG